MSEPREFWLDDTGERYDDGNAIVFEGHLSRHQSWDDDFDPEINIHVIEYSAYEQVVKERYGHLERINTLEEMRNILIKNNRALTKDFNIVLETLNKVFDIWIAHGCKKSIHSCDICKIFESAGIKAALASIEGAK